MALTAGTRLGPYEIVSALGAGGMGEVYRVRDTKLERVAPLKVLPDAVAGDPDRIARFAFEARALAALNHPHIATLYGMEDRSDLVRHQARDLLRHVRHPRHPHHGRQVLVEGGWFRAEKPRGWSAAR